MCQEPAFVSVTMATDFASGEVHPKISQELALRLSAANAGIQNAAGHLRRLVVCWHLGLGAALPAQAWDSRAPSVVSMLSRFMLAGS